MSNKLDKRLNSHRPGRGSPPADVGGRAKKTPQQMSIISKCIRNSKKIPYLRERRTKNTRVPKIVEKIAATAPTSVLRDARNLLHISITDVITKVSRKGRACPKLKPPIAHRVIIFFNIFIMTATQAAAYLASTYVGWNKNRDLLFANEFFFVPLNNSFKKNSRNLKNFTTDKAGFKKEALGA